MRFKELFTESTERSISGNEELLSLSGKLGVIPRKTLTDKVERASTLIGYKVVRKGDLVVNKMQAHNGMAAISEFDGLVSPDYSVYIVKNSEIGKFTELCMRSEHYKEIIRGLSKGATEGFNRLNSKDFYTLPIVNITHKKMEIIASSIGSKVSVADKYIKELEFKLTALEDYKTALIHNAVTKGLDANGCRILDGAPAADVQWKPSGVEWIGDVPDGWDVGKIKESISFTCGGEVIDKSFWDIDGKEVLYTASQNSMMSSFPDFPDNKRANKNDVLIARNGNGAIHLPVGGEIFTNVVQKITINSGFDRCFVSYFLTLAKEYEVSKCYGDIIASLNMEFWSNCPLMKCGLNEQTSILNYLDKSTSIVDNSKELVNKKIALLVEYKKSLINEAVSGDTFI